jgi:hypothetical protein
MTDIDPGLAIVLTVGVILVASLALAWRRRSAAKARMEALRASETIELEVESVGRRSAVMLAALLPIIFGTPFVAMGLGEWGRAHALGFVIALLVLTMLAIVVTSLVPLAWTRVGRIVLTARSLRVELPEAQASFDLTRPFTLREGLVLPGPRGQRTELMLGLEQGETTVTLRYPLLFGDESFAQGAPVMQPAGVLLTAEARVLHERLRERSR